MNGALRPGLGDSAGGIDRSRVCAREECQRRSQPALWKCRAKTSLLSRNKDTGRRRKSQYDLKIPSLGQPGRLGNMIYSINKPERRAGINAECIFGGRRGLGAARPGRGWEPFGVRAQPRHKLPLTGAIFSPAFSGAGSQGKQASC